MILVLRKLFLLEEKRGFVSVETVFAMSIFLAFFMLVLGFFSYVYPYTNLQREVHVLATIAERQGGLTPEDIANFKSRLEAYPFIQQTDQVDVFAYVADTLEDVTDVTPLGVEGDHYVKRDSKDLIVVEVRVPSNGKLLRSAAKFFGVDGISDQYILKETVASFRN